MQYPVKTLLFILVLAVPSCGKKKRKAAFPTVGQQSLLQNSGASDLNALAEKCGAGLNVADTLGYNDYLGSIDGSLLKVGVPKVQVLDYGNYSSLIMKCETLESASLTDYQSEYCQITVLDETESEKITQLNSYTGVEEIHIANEFLGQKLVVETHGCTTRSETSSDCGKESQKTRKSTKRSENTELSEHLAKMRENENRRGEICLGLLDSAQKYRDKVDVEKMTKSQEVMYGLANYIINNPERFADFCAKNVIDYAIETQQQLEEIQRLSEMEGSPLRLAEGSDSEACKEYLKGLQDGLGLDRFTKGSLSLTEFQDSDEYHEERRKENEENIKNNQTAQYATGGVLIAAGVVMLGVTVKLWRDFGKSLKAGKEHHVEKGDKYGSNRLKQQKAQEVKKAQGISPDPAPSKFPPELDANGRVKTEFHDNGKTKKTVDYDENGRAKTITDYDTQGTESQKRSIEYDDQGKIKQETLTDLKNENTKTTIDYENGQRVKQEVEANGKKSVVSVEYDDLGRVSKEITTFDDGRVVTDNFKDGKRVSTSELTETGGVKTTVVKDANGVETKRIVDAPVEGQSSQRLVTETTGGVESGKKIVETSNVGGNKHVAEFEVLEGGGKGNARSLTVTEVAGDKTTTRTFIAAPDKNAINFENPGTYKSGETLFKEVDTTGGKTKTIEYVGSDPKVGKRIETTIDGGKKTITEYSDNVGSKRTVFDPEVDFDGRRVGTKKIEVSEGFTKPTKQTEISFDSQGKSLRQTDVELTYKGETDTITKRVEKELLDPDGDKSKLKQSVETDYDDLGKFKEETSKNFKENGVDVESSSKTKLQAEDPNVRQRVDYDGEGNATKRTQISVDETDKLKRTEIEMADPKLEKGGAKKFETSFEGERVRSEVSYGDGDVVEKRTQYDFDPETGKTNKISEMDLETGKKVLQVNDVDPVSGDPKRTVDFDENGKLKSSSDLATGKKFDYDPVTGKAKVPDTDLGTRPLDVDGVSPRQKISNTVDGRSVEGSGKPVKYNDYDGNTKSGKKSVSGDLDGKLKMDADGKFASGAKAMAGSLLTMALLGGGITLLTQAMGLADSGCNRAAPEAAFACEFGSVEEELIRLIDEYQVLLSKKQQLIENALRETQNAQEVEVSE